MRIYTKSGDDGTTGLIGGIRLPKTHARFSALGTIDELNASLGVALASEPSSLVAERLNNLQSLLFSIGAEVATPQDSEFFQESVQLEHLEQWEKEMDAMTETMPTLRNFVLPGGKASSAALHLARTICRRAEREILILSQETQIRPTVLHALNRLSDWLFVAARYENHCAGLPDVIWSK